MTVFRGINATRLLTDKPRNMIPVGEQAGRIRVAYDKYTFTAVIDTTDSLLVMKIPKGARVLDCIIKFADLGSTGAFNIGWQASSDAVESADADGFFAAVDVNAAANVLSARDDAASPAGILKEFSAEVQVVIVPSTITTATSGDIEIFIEYVLD